MSKDTLSALFAPEDAMKTFSEIQETLSASKNNLMQKYQVQEIGIFGSYVRNTQTDHSDVDVLVDFENVPNLYDLVGLRDELSDLLGIKVDLVMKTALKPRIGQRILQEVVLL